MPHNKSSGQAVVALMLALAGGQAVHWLITPAQHPDASCGAGCCGLGRLCVAGESWAPATARHSAAPAMKQQVALWLANASVATISAACAAARHPRWPGAREDRTRPQRGWLTGVSSEPHGRCSTSAARRIGSVLAVHKSEGAA
jgi:hypothetical protein